jgi:hypothetical protein
MNLFKLKLIFEELTIYSILLAKYYAFAQVIGMILV